MLGIAGALLPTSTSAARPRAPERAIEAPAPSRLHWQRRAIRLQIAGSVLIPVSAVGLTAALVLWARIRSDTNAIFDALTPGPTGFPAGHYDDWRAVEQRLPRLRMAGWATAASSYVALGSGMALVVIGTQRRHVSVVPLVWRGAGLGVTARF